MTAYLKRAPDTTDEHLWADYFELVCLTSEEGRLSRGDVEEYADQLKDVDANVPRPNTSPGLSAAELVDNRKLLVDDLFRHLDYRANTFGSAYPFELATGGRALQRLPPEPASRDARVLYVLLLIASALEHLEPAPRQAIAVAFELIAADAIRNWMPAPAEVHHFGTNAPAPERFPGDLAAKVKELASALGEQAYSGPNIYRSPNNGDGGLDVVAWFGFSDHARAAQAVFVQATCQKDWVNKPSDLRYEKWKNRLTLTVPPPSVLVIPYCFRSPDGTWYLDGDITCVTIDRQRIIAMLTGTPVVLHETVISLVEDFGLPAAA